ncbi:hypothetical protein [Arthrobacter cavernae]|nr:hypothetical protein [Arthrobacter cavernae]
MDGAVVRELVEAMTLLAPSLDPGPHQNVSDGCIRVPGSVHKSGGHQVLLTPLAAAYDVLRRRNPAAAVDRLLTALTPELHRTRELKARNAKMANRAMQMPATASDPLSGSESTLRRVARTGLYDTARYKGPSEARMAVLNHFAACGWTLEQVQRELAGQFPGLAALYGSQARQERLLHREWARACAWIQKPATPQRGAKHAFINNTSLPEPTGGGGISSSKAAVHQLVNDVENVLYAVLDHRLKDRGREGLGLRLLLRAILGYMRTMETDVLDVGCRTLATALGKHHVTIARLLPVLVTASDGILVKVAEGRRRTADVYLVQLPAAYRELARELSWRRGKIHGIRPVFRGLGDPAALVYEAIERGRHAPTGAEIIRSTGLSRSAVETALADMAALDMIARQDRSWRVNPAVGLLDLARRLGVMEEVSAQISRHRRERAAWHAWLDRHLVPDLAEYEVHDVEVDEYWLPPSPDDPGLAHRIWYAA